MSHTFLTFLDLYSLTFHKSNNYRLGLIKIDLSSACLSLNWYIWGPTLYAPPSMYQGVLEQKITYVFSATYVICWHPQLTTYVHVSNIAAHFDLVARLLQRAIRQVTFAHPCIAIDSCKKWWCVVKDRGNVRAAQKGLHAFRNKWLLKSQFLYIIQMAFHRNKSWDFRVQVFISVISFQRNYTKLWVGPTFLRDKKYLTERHLRYLCLQNA